MKKQPLGKKDDKLIPEKRKRIIIPGQSGIIPAKQQPIPQQPGQRTATKGQQVVNVPAFFMLPGHVAIIYGFIQWALTDKAFHGDQKIREEAENMLLQMEEFFNHFGIPPHEYKKYVPPREEEESEEEEDDSKQEETNNLSDAGGNE